MDRDSEGACPNNVLLFRLAISNSFEQIAESVSKDEFLKTLTTLSENPSRAHKLHKAMIKELYESMSTDFENILDEGSLEAALAKVGKLSESGDSSVLENAWRPPGDVSVHLRSADAEKISQETVILEEQLTKLEAENEVLMNEVAGKRSKLSGLNENITRSLNQSPKALHSLENRLEQLERCLKLLQKV